MLRLFKSCSLAGTLLLTSGFSAFGQEIDFETVAVRGAMVLPQGTAVFGGMGPAVLNRTGGLAFRADLEEGGVVSSAIIRRTNGSNEVMARSGDRLDPFQESGGRTTRATLSTLGDPVLANTGALAFEARLVGRGEVIPGSASQVLLASGSQDGRLSVVARSGRSASLDIAGVEDPFSVLRLGDFAFGGNDELHYRTILRTPGWKPSFRDVTYRVPELMNSELFVPDYPLVSLGDGFEQTPESRTPEAPGGKSSAILGDGEIRLLISEASGSRLDSTLAGSTLTLLKTGTVFPSLPGYFISEIRGNLANPGPFPSYLIAARSGDLLRHAIILRGRSRPVLTIAIDQNPAPGLGDGSIFDSFQVPVSSAVDAVVFEARLRLPDGSTSSSLWRKLVDEAEPRLLAREGEQAPGMNEGVSFRSFGGPLVNSLGQVIFPASLNHGGGIDTRNDFAWFLSEPNRELKRIIGEGDSFEFGEAGVLPIVEIGASDFNEAGEIAFTLGAGDDISALVQATIPPGELKHYDLWAATHLPPPVDQSRSADPDGDGVENFREYAFGSDPLDPGSVSLPQMRLLTEEGSRILSLEFSRLADGVGARYLVEFSDDLETWLPSSEVETLGPPEGLPARELVRVSASAVPSQKRNFVRITVTE